MVLGVHVSLRNQNSRIAILNTLGTIFFLTAGTLITISLILINGKLATPESVSSAVQELIINNPNGQALISADQDARHGDVVRAIDLVKSAGLQRFAIQIEKP